MSYVDSGIVDDTCRVTFEAENNLDFRLGTGKLRNTRLAQANDLALISRVGESEYELRIVKHDSPEHAVLRPYAVAEIGHRGKRYGFVSNKQTNDLIGTRLPTKER